VAAAVDRFGRVDVLVNNAGNFNAGFFEELSPEEFRAQIETTFFGPVNVTRAALPVMRAQRSGLVVTISSTAGLEGGARRHRQPDQAKRRPRRNLGRRFPVVSNVVSIGPDWCVSVALAGHPPDRDGAPLSSA
jgi:NAD(P)-dependent dehydrogenase (short-subunit alcohol dehydrogenase family)